MREWQTSPLDECLDTLLDYRGKSPSKSAKGIPVLSAKVVKTTGLLRPIEQKIALDYYPTWMVRGLPHVGDIVMTTEAPMGEVIQLDQETVQYALGQRIVCLRGKPNKLDNKFLRYLLTSPAQQAILAGAIPVAGYRAPLSAEKHRSSAAERHCGCDHRLPNDLSALCPRAWHGRIYPPQLASVRAGGFAMTPEDRTR
jgi:hypothetical protein